MQFFFTIVLFHCLTIGYQKDPYYLNNLQMTSDDNFVDMKHFLLRNMTKNGQNWNYFSCIFRYFFCFWTRFLAHYELTIALRSSGHPIGLNNFFWFYVLLYYWKILNFFSFLVQVAYKSLFHDLAFRISRKIL